MDIGGINITPTKYCYKRMKLMKKKSIVFSVFPQYLNVRNIALIMMLLLALDAYSVMAPLDIQTNDVVESCLIQDDLDSLLSYFNNDEEAAISSLCSYEMNTQMGIGAFWFCEAGEICLCSVIDQNQVFSRSGESLRLKSIYWTIVLFYKLNRVKGEICEFYDAKHSKMEDIWMANKYGSIDVLVVIKHTSLEAKAKRWQEMLRKKGLEYLRTKNVFFLKPNEYTILKPTECKIHDREWFIDLFGRFTQYTHVTP